MEQINVDSWQIDAICVFLFSPISTNFEFRNTMTLSVFVLHVFSLYLLFTKGEFKPSVINAPSGYTYYYFTNPTSCTSAAKDCLDYFTATTLKSKKNNPGGVQGYFYVKNGKSCRVSTATAPTVYTSFDALTCL